MALNPARGRAVAGLSPGRLGRLRRREAWTGFFLISPWLVGLVVFTLGPLVASLYLSLTRYTLLTPPAFVGLANYEHLIHSHDFWLSLWVTTYYAVFAIPLDLAVALGMALLLNQNVRFRSFFRTVFYLPVILPPAAVAMLWNWILNPSYGIVNQILGFLRLPQPQWLVSPEWTVPAYILMSMWGVGTWMIILLAGLGEVPESLYEAARIDGAGVWPLFWKVTLPMISPVLLFNLVMGIVGSFSFFTQAYILGNGLGTGAGVNNAGLFYVLNIYFVGFTQLRMGYASALAWVLFLIIMALTLLVLKWSALWVYYGGERA